MGSQEPQAVQQEKCQALHLRRHYPMQQSVHAGGRAAGRQLSEKDVMSCWTPSWTQARNRPLQPRRPMPRCLALGGVLPSSDPLCSASSPGLPTTRETELLQEVQQGAMKIEGLEHFTWDSQDYLEWRRKAQMKSHQCVKIPKWRKQGGEIWAQSNRYRLKHRRFSRNISKHFFLWG